LNEVGGDPDCHGFSLDEFHGYQQEMQRTFPATMTTLSTHDTKRSDDVRARLAVLTELPGEFADAAQRWSRMGSEYRGEAVDRGTEWFLFQTMVGAWPIDSERLRGYMQKAMREAKLRTSWVTNNAEYESALNSYIDTLLADTKFTASLEAFVAKVLHAGRVNSLAQTLVKYTAPGVPDLYQGGELWDLSLVDPDNRRPVDYELRERLLHEVEKLDAAGLLARMDDGLPKMAVVRAGLAVRREKPEWFGEHAAYEPLRAEGNKAAHVIAFVRGGNVITVAPLRTLSVGDQWGDTAMRLPQGTWRNRITGEVVSGALKMSDLLAKFPVALLTRV
jgi:(1->4)-alpha-D-glucan 1-alpha-D-glucosylmutase